MADKPVFNKLFRNWARVLAWCALVFSLPARKMKLRGIILYLCVAVVCSGCGAKFQFEQAQKLEKNGYYVQAGFKYHNICQKYPADQICPQALYRLSVIYQKKLKLYNQAAQYFKKLIEYYPSFRTMERPWQKRESLTVLITFR